jgi:hypothetical protein
MRPGLAGHTDLSIQLVWNEGVQITTLFLTER